MQKEILCSTIGFTAPMNLSLSMNASLTKKLWRFSAEKSEYLYIVWCILNVFFSWRVSKNVTWKRNKQVMHFQLLKFIHHIFYFFHFSSNCQTTFKSPLKRTCSCYFPDRQSFSYFSIFEMILHNIIIHKDLKSTDHLSYFQIAVACIHNLKRMCK